MQNRQYFFFSFFFFFLCSLFIYFAQDLSFFQAIQNITAEILLPLQRVLVFPSSASQNLDYINKTSQTVQIQMLQKENQALLDQFQNQSPKSRQLLAATVLGLPRFIPGVTSPEFLIIDKGEIDTVKKGQAVVYKNNAVGLVTKTSKFLSEVSLVTNSSISFTAQIAAASSSPALGIIKGQGGNDMILDNVLLSETLNQSDIVTTKGDVTLSSNGFVPNLIVGKIVSVDKKPSSLFQIAQVKSILDFSRLSTVFIVVQSQSQ